METTVQIDSSQPGKLKQILSYSLESTDTVSYTLDTDNDSLIVRVETEGLGQLRGCTDTVFRLSSLVEKLY